MGNIHKFVAASMLSAGLLGVTGGTVSADPPTVFEFSVTFDDVNPCTGDDMEVTINGVDSVHFHDGREVVRTAVTGSTDNGDVMEHGGGSFVFNGQVARGAFTDNWVGPDGSRWQAQGSFVFNLNQEELRVDRFRLRCISA